MVYNIAINCTNDRPPKSCGAPYKTQSGKTYTHKHSRIFTATQTFRLALVITLWVYLESDTVNRNLFWQTTYANISLARMKQQSSEEWKEVYLSCGKSFDHLIYYTSFRNDRLLIKSNILKIHINSWRYTDILNLFYNSFDKRLYKNFPWLSERSAPTRRS